MPETVAPNIDNTPQQEVEARKERNRRAALMLQSWLDEEDDGYDERVWPVIESALKDDPIRIGELDESGS